MALLHMRRTLTNGCSEQVVASDEVDVDDDSSSPTHGLEVIGVQGRVQEMVLRFSVTGNGLYCNALCCAVSLVTLGKTTVSDTVVFPTFIL